MRVRSTDLRGRPIRKKRLRRSLRDRMPAMPYIDGDDVILGLVIFVIGAFVIGAVWWGIWDANRIDQINQRFSDRCHSRGGHAVITDKDLCIRKGLVIDWEH